MDLHVKKLFKSRLFYTTVLITGWPFGRRLGGRLAKIMFE